MCGIVGVFVKDPSLEPQLGALLVPMLEALTERGPDSTGVASTGQPGEPVEVVKDVGPAPEVCRRYGIAGRTGYQGIGHTRMATESAVTARHSHPFSPAPDLCVVHNGSFTNHASVRRRLEADGRDLRHRQRLRGGRPVHRLPPGGGDDLEEAMRWVQKAFDGFFTLLVTTADPVRRGPRRLRLQAGGRGRDRPLRGRGLGVPGLGRPARHRRAPRCSSPPPGRSTRGPASAAAQLSTLDCEALSVREINRALRRLPEEPRPLLAPRGRHNLAVGSTTPVDDHHRGQRRLLHRRPQRRTRRRADHHRRRLRRVVRRREPDGRHHPGAGAAPRRAPARRRKAGLIVIEGDASLRAGISLKGGTIAIAGDAGAMSRLHGPGRDHAHRWQRRARPRRLAVRGGDLRGRPDRRPSGPTPGSRSSATRTWRPSRTWSS